MSARPGINLEQATLNIALDRVLAHLALSPDIKTISLGDVSTGLSHSERVMLNVSRPTTSGFKVIATVGQEGYEIDIDTDLSERELGILMAETIHSVHDLTPADIPMEERWLWQNPIALATVQEGLKQAQAESHQSLGEFTQYANLAIED